MTLPLQFEKSTKSLIDSLKSICSTYGLGGDGNEFKIITQVFLYKFLNDKFIHEIKAIEPKLKDEEKLLEVLQNYPADEYEMLMMQLSESTAQMLPEQFIAALFNRQNEPNFDQLFDNTLLAIAKLNTDIFSVMTNGGEKVMLFENISKYVTDNRDEFCRAIINKLVGFSFEPIFSQKFDFFSTIFEYLIKDYNSNSGGNYAEYFTPHSVASIMARCLVQSEVSNVSCYDPSAGSGSLLMNLAHQIGEDRCSIYSQDISQKSSNLLRLNLILNNLVHSIHNIVKGNTILDPYHREEDGSLMKFDYIVSNPPFKLDFSDFSADLDTKANNERFFAGIPNVPKAKKESMAIYVMFIQHIMFSLKNDGKAAIVVPTGFITAQSGIERKIRERLVEQRMLRGVVSMPSNIFANTGTNVSVLFLDKANTKGDIVLLDASKLGTAIKEGKNQKTVLSPDDESLIIDTFNGHKAVEDFSVVVSYDQIKEKNYSFSAGQYFEVKIEYVDISAEEFEAKMEAYKSNLTDLFTQSHAFEKDIMNQLKNLNYE